MKKGYVEVNGIQMHYRITGTGPTLFVLHASPRSSQMMEPFMQILSGNFRVIAPDTPGYGNSDPLPVAHPTMFDYVPYFESFFRHFTDQPVQVYGTATGGQLCIAYGLKYPESVGRIFPDNAAHFSDDTRNRIVEHYFPDFSPQSDGTHLMRLWIHIRESFLFFPWFDYREGRRITSGMPPAAVLNDVLLDYLRAGPDWDKAYRAAFAFEKAENVKPLTVPTTIFRWEGGLMIDAVNDLIASELPTNIEVVNTPKPLLERYATMRDAMVERLC